MPSILAKEEGEKRNYIASALLAAIIVIPLTKLIAPELIPFSYFGAWSTHGTRPDQWLWAGLPIFAWGFGFTLLVSLYGRFKGRSLGAAAGGLFKGAYTKAEMVWVGIKASAWASFSEEVAFRWLIYYGGFTSVAIINFLFFGWLGLGLPEWFHINIWGPLANLTTFGYLEQWIFNPTTWLAGAAMLYANAFFRDGHKYLGLIGVVNSWFLGMFFFYMMFTYGLLAAIIVHFVYDWLVFTTIALIWGD